MTAFILFLAVGLILLVGFESGLLPTGTLISDDKSTEFMVASIVEVANIALIPLSLRLFKIKRVSTLLTTPEALLKWGMIRLTTLCTLLLIDILLYYMFLNVAFGYLAIIVFICLFFIVPTYDRCLSELTEDTQTHD